MNNNDILRSLRYAFAWNETKMLAIFALAEHRVAAAEQISGWLKKEDEPGYQPCSDTQLAIFLNGVINEKRGKKEGPQSQPEQRLTNNIILRKLKIALNLKDEDMLTILALADARLSKHELSAFFRRPDHPHYRECKDQILRGFLKGVGLKCRAPLG
jgi:uncharacterized protein YehS (DUF1456 family)